MCNISLNCESLLHCNRENTSGVCRIAAPIGGYCEGGPDNSSTVFRQASVRAPSLSTILMTKLGGATTSRALTSAMHLSTSSRALSTDIFFS